MTAHKNFEFNENAIQYRFSKKEMVDIGIDLDVIKSMKVFIQKQHDCKDEANTAKAHVLLSVMPTEKPATYSGFQDKTRWFKTDIKDKDLTEYHKHLTRVLASTNTYITYTISVLKDNEYAMNIIDELAYKFYDNTVK